ncbi:hypothetical protein [Paenibacillus sp. NPDC058071]
MEGERPKPDDIPIRLLPDRRRMTGNRRLFAMSLCAARPAVSVS